MHKSSRELLVMMDAIVELFQYARRGEDHLREDSATIAVMVKKSRATLRGIIAGFVVADLTSTLKKVPEDVW